MPEPFVPLNKIRGIEIDKAAEVRKVIASKGLDRIPAGSQPLTQVYQVYRNLKALGFFSLVMGRLGNTEYARDTDLRTSDVYAVSTDGGRIFFVVEASMEAIDAFADDGSVLLKIREWLGDAYRRVAAAGEAADPVKRWDDAFHAPGSPLPADVEVVPFYHQELAPGVPGVVLVLVKERRSALT